MTYEEIIFCTPSYCPVLGHSVNWKRIGWTKINKNTKLISNEIYKVRMCVGVDENEEDIYDEFECLYNEKDNNWITTNNNRSFDFIDMDDMWIE